MEALIALDFAGLEPLLQILMKDIDSAWLLEAAHHILHVLKGRGRPSTPMLKVFRALEGVEPGYTVPWAAKPAGRVCLDPKEVLELNKLYIGLGRIFCLPCRN